VSLSPGQQVDSYELLEVLGQGGSGTVYRALDRQGSREVALKVVYAPSPAKEQRFATEVDALGRLDHANVVRLYASGRVGRSRYLVMDLVKGESLDRRLARQGALDVAAATALVATLADAVAAAHAEGLLHRDLKPENVILRASDGRPVLVDFGLAKDLSDASGPTQTGAIMGTPGFWAPEQARGLSDEIGVATDVFGLGGILYACLTTHSPFVGESLAQVVRSTLEHAPAPVSNFQPVPRWLERACMRCLEKAPEARYDSPAALAAALRQGGHSATLGRSRLGAALVGLGLLAALGLWLLGPQERRSNPQPSPEASSPEALPSPEEVRFATPEGFTKVWELKGGPAPEVPRPTQWATPGFVADPLAGLRKPGGLVEAFVGQAELQGEEVLVRYDPRDLHLRHDASLRHLNRGYAGMTSLQPVKDGTWRILAPNDAGYLILDVGTGWWVDARLKVRVRQKKVDLSYVRIMFHPAATGFGIAQRNRYLGTDARRIPWSGASEVYTAEVAPGARRGERVRFDGRLLPSLEMPEEGGARPGKPRVVFTEVEAWIHLLEVRGRCVRPDRRAAAWAKPELPPEARVALAFSQENVSERGGPWVGLGTPDAGPMVLAEIEGRTLRLALREHLLGSLELPAAPTEGRLVLTRAEDALTVELRAGGAVRRLRVAFPLALPRGLRLGYGASAGRVSCQAAAWTGAADPLRAAFDEASAASQAWVPTSDPRAQWWAGASHLAALVEGRGLEERELFGEAGAPEMRRQAGEVLKLLAVAARDLPPESRRDALARALLAAVLQANAMAAEQIGLDLGRLGRKEARRALEAVYPDACENFAAGFDVAAHDPAMACAAVVAYRPLQRPEEQAATALTLATSHNLRISGRWGEPLTQEQKRSLAQDVLALAEEVRRSKPTRKQRSGAAAEAATACRILGDAKGYERNMLQVLRSPYYSHYSFYWANFARYLKGQGRADEALEAYVGSIARRGPTKALGSFLSSERVSAAAMCVGVVGLHLAGRYSKRAALKPIQSAAKRALGGPLSLRQRDLVIFALRSVGAEAPPPTRPHEARPTLVLLSKASDTELQAACADDLLVSSLVRLVPQLRARIRVR
jgi:tetratricopeptide (TPR) repeat protein